MPKSGLDVIDHRIVAALQVDGRLTNADLAQRVGLSASPCLRRVNRLEREGYIEGYRAMPRRDQIGLGLTVFVGVKINGHANEMATAFEEAIVAFPEVVACHMISGDADYLLEVVVPDLERYRRFLIGNYWSLPWFMRFARILRFRPSRQEGACRSIILKPDNGAAEAGRVMGC
jgi:Lrp/AsnC family leucine-responsive transcriptional regulator